ncbi:MAG TPA: type II toxin-antitoxin system MqsA family antitoxin [Thermodesulfobacteriota bacterium]|nr:type II toxin-antitoxin system MqsA family antitoxin [Thermodesulfobacteriota bacterium]
MKCGNCKDGETRPGKATFTLEKGGATVVIKNIPADVCAGCGEEYIGDEVTFQLLKIAEGPVKAGVKVEIREYVEG